MGKHISLFAVLLTVSICIAQDINISGRVVNASGEAISGASIGLETAGLTATTGADGRFSLSNATAVYHHQVSPHALDAAFYNGVLTVEVAEKSLVTITTFSLEGKTLSQEQLLMDAETRSLVPSPVKAGVYFYRITSGAGEVFLKSCSPGRGLREFRRPGPGKVLSCGSGKTCHGRPVVQRCSHCHRNRIPGLQDEYDQFQHQRY
ncbi:carboxypeptidase regulatory-like domain-containing protein [Fibrobacterota bacterium]